VGGEWLPTAHQPSTLLVVDTFQCERLVKRRRKGISLAEISRSEGLSRARVTQLMSLLKLPESVQQGLWLVRRKNRVYS
jgi:hypothetical protein